VVILFLFKHHLSSALHPQLNSSLILRV